LSDVGLSKGVSLSIQSTNQTTLKNIKRKNISISVFQELQNKFNKESIETFTDIILGLPCETYSSFADGVSKVISNGQHNRIQFNNLSILTGSEMDDELYKKKYDIVTVKSRLVNVHGSLIEKNKIDEYQNIVVETKAMPREDWIKARIFSWMVALLHFDKLTQIPFILLNRKCSISYREMIEKIIEHSREYTVLNEIVLFFEDQAKSIQKGWPEYTESRQWLDIWWPPDEYMMINICANNKLEAFYSDMESLLIKYILGDVSADIIDELKSAMLLNKKLVKLPNKSEDIILKFQYNIWDFYRFALENKEYILEKGSFKNKIDRTSCKWNSWEDWCREVIWYGNKRGAYLYQCTTVK
jgi:hypothetical protein